MLEVYQRYNFNYDEKLFMSNLKKALNEKGIKSLGAFHNLLIGIGVPGYEIARSYYNLRRTVPFDVLVRICEKLDLNATEIMFPGSILDPLCERFIASNHKDYNNIFNTLYFMYSDSLKSDDEVLDYEKSEIDETLINNSVEKLSLILHKYNYLLQKFYYADVANTEIKDLGVFSECFLSDRKTLEKLDWHEFKKWKEELKSNDFLEDFYEKYTLTIYDYTFKEIVEYFKNNISKEVFNNLNNLLPENDRIINE